MKAACEVCGSPLRTGPNKVEIDGAIMVVCGNCVRLGRPVGGPIVREAHHGSFQPSFRSSVAPPSPEYEVDPDYNLKIRQAREKLGLSPEGHGKMLNEKPSLIRMVESKKLKPDMILTRKLMHYLKVNLLVPLSELEGPNSGILNLTAEKSIRVLRIGHRYVRDYRTLTHLCLVSRALGAESISLEEIDDGLLEGIREVNETWGGSFEVRQIPSWKSEINAAKKEDRTVVHLTMYGMPLMDKVAELREKSSFLVAVGGPKVPGEVYKMADYNIAVSSQPHSETAALAIALHELQEGEELKKEFGHSKMKILPSEKGEEG